MCQGKERARKQEMLAQLNAPSYTEWQGLDAHLVEVAAEVGVSGPELSEDGVVMLNEVGVQLEGEAPGPGLEMAGASRSARLRPGC